MATISRDGTVEPGRRVADMTGSGLVGSIATTYEALVATFGEPDYRDWCGAPDVFYGWTLHTPFGPVKLYDHEANVRVKHGYRHDEHPTDTLRYSVGAHPERAVQTFACVVAALAKANQPFEITDHLARPVAAASPRAATIAPEVA